MDVRRGIDKRQFDNLEDLEATSDTIWKQYLARLPQTRSDEFGHESGPSALEEARALFSAIDEAELTPLQKFILLRGSYYGHPTLTRGNYIPQNQERFERLTKELWKPEGVVIELPGAYQDDSTERKSGDYTRVPQSIKQDIAVDKSGIAFLDVRSTSGIYRIPSTNLFKTERNLEPNNSFSTRRASQILVGKAETNAYLFKASTQFLENKTNNKPTAYLEGDIKAILHLTGDDLGIDCSEVVNAKGFTMLFATCTSEDFKRELAEQLQGVLKPHSKLVSIKEEVRKKLLYSGLINGQDANPEALLDAAVSAICWSIASELPELQQQFDDTKAAHETAVTTLRTSKKLLRALGSSAAK